MKLLMNFVLFLMIGMAPLAASPSHIRTDSIESGRGCPSGKCPGSAYDKYGYRPNPGPTYTIPHKRVLCHPGGPCDLRDKESKGIKTGVKNWGRQHCASNLLDAFPAVWYKGQHLVNPRYPNRCHPLAPSLTLNEKAKASSIYKHAHGLPSLLYDVPAKHKNIGGSPGCHFENTWLYETPNDLDRGRPPAGAGTRLFRCHGHGHHGDCHRGHGGCHGGYGGYYGCCPLYCPPYGPYGCGPYGDGCHVGIIF